MECLQSFNIRVNQAITATSASGSVRTWGTLNQYFFSLTQTPSNLPSIFNLSGFKSTDIYGVAVTGYVQGFFDSANKCAVVDDWSFGITINGNSPLVAGQKSTVSDGFNIFTRGTALNTIALSKNTNSINFINPYTSVQDIRFAAIQAQGRGAEFLNEVSIIYDLMFTFYYKYEGE